MKQPREPYRKRGKITLADDYLNRSQGKAALSRAPKCLPQKSSGDNQGPEKGYKRVRKSVISVVLCKTTCKIQDGCGGVVSLGKQQVSWKEGSPRKLVWATVV